MLWFFPMVWHLLLSILVNRLHWGLYCLAKGGTRWHTGWYKCIVCVCNQSLHVCQVWEQAVLPCIVVWAVGCIPVLYSGGRGMHLEKKNACTLGRKASTLLLIHALNFQLQVLAQTFNNKDIIFQSRSHFCSVTSLQFPLVTSVRSWEKQLLVLQSLTEEYFLTTALGVKSLFERLINRGCQCNMELNATEGRGNNKVLHTHRPAAGFWWCVHVIQFHTRVLLPKKKTTVRFGGQLQRKLKGEKC